MAATMTSCSNAILAKKGIMQILHLYHEDFQKRSQERYEQMVVFISSRNLQVY